MVSTVNTLLPGGPAFAALSKARYSRVSADDTTHGPVYGVLEVVGSERDVSSSAFSGVRAANTFFGGMLSHIVVGVPRGPNRPLRSTRH